MRLTVAVLGACLVLSAAPARAQGWCWAERLTAPGYDNEERFYSPRTWWHAETSRDEAYHEIFGDGPGEGHHARRRRHRSGGKSAPTGAQSAAPAAAASGAPPAAPDPAPSPEGK